MFQTAWVSSMVEGAERIKTACGSIECYWSKWKLWKSCLCSCWINSISHCLECYWYKKANQHQSNCSSNRHDNHWIVNSKAIDHMTFDPNDFSCVTQPRRSVISNATSVQYLVIGAGIVILSSSQSLPNALLIPSLSNKLLSVNQIIVDFNCVALIYSIFCLL